MVLIEEQKLFLSLVVAPMISMENLLPFTLNRWSNSGGIIAYIALLSLHEISVVLLFPTNFCSVHFHFFPTSLLISTLPLKLS